MVVFIGGKRELKVPVIVIGDSVIKGYNRDQLKSALVAAGYTEESSEETTEEAAE